MTSNVKVFYAIRTTKKAGAMKALSVNLFICIGLVGGLFALSMGISRHFKFPYPPFNTLPQNETYLFDLGGIMLGMRRIAADIAWVHLMHYYARDTMTKEEQLEREYYDFIKNKDHNGHVEDSYHPDFNVRKGHEKLYEKTLRVVHLDPFFHYAYIYSSGVLAWNLKRYDEAYELLRLGMKNDPTHWRYGEYLGAIMYKEKGDVQRMVPLLEKIVTYKECPNLIKSMLANYYEKIGQYYKSLKLWLTIYDSGDKEYARRSFAQIQELKEILNISDR